MVMRTMIDRDLGVDRHPLAALHTVIVDEGVRLVDAVGEFFDDVAALALGLVENLRDGVENGVPAVFVEQLGHAADREPACRHLRFHVAERGFRETGCCP